MTNWNSLQVLVVNYSQVKINIGFGILNFATMTNSISCENNSWMWNYRGGTNKTLEVSLCICEISSKNPDL